MNGWLFEIRVNALFDRQKLLAILAENGYTVHVEARIKRKTFDDKDYFIVVTAEPEYPEYREGHIG